MPCSQAAAIQIVDFQWKPWTGLWYLIHSEVEQVFATSSIVFPKQKQQFLFRLFVQLSFCWNWAPTYVKLPDEESVKSKLPELGAHYTCRMPHDKIGFCLCDVRPSAVWTKVTAVKASYQGRIGKRIRMTVATNTPSAHLSRPLTLPVADIGLLCWDMQSISYS